MAVKLPVLELHVSNTVSQSNMILACDTGTLWTEWVHCLGKTLFYHWQWTAIIEKLTVTQLVNKFCYFHVLRWKFCTYFSFLHASKPPFYSGILSTPSHTNKTQQTNTNTQTHVVLSCSVGLPAHEAKNEIEPGQSTCKSGCGRFYEMTVLAAIV